MRFDKQTMLWHTLFMANVAPLPKQKDRADNRAADARTEQTLALVRTLLGSLPPEDRERFYREIAEKTRSTAAPRAGEVLGTIIRLLPRKEAWSMAELKQQVDGQGVEATDKEIYNAVGYLARKGRVRRVGYGRYLVDGTLLETADELGGQPSITEGDLDD